MSSSPPPVLISLFFTPYLFLVFQETLFASENSDDWIRISTMLLGPVPSDFKFEPKHKAKSYSPGFSALNAVESVKNETIDS